MKEFVWLKMEPGLIAPAFAIGIPSGKAGAIN